MEIKIKRIENGKLPEYKTIGSAGADCYARIKKDVIIQPGKNSTIPLGFAVEIPDGYEMQIRGRSGLASKSDIEGFTGTIDSDYRGEVSAILFNHSDKDFIVKNGDRIAQAIIAPVIKAEWYLTDKLSETERGEGGFGHTGISENKEIEMSYPHKVEKFYEPFKNAQELENLLGKEVVVDNAYKATFTRITESWLSISVGFRIIGATRADVDLSSVFSRDVEMNIVTAFERVKINGHRFGREIVPDEEFKDD